MCVCVLRGKDDMGGCLMFFRVFVSFCLLVYLYVCLFVCLCICMSVSVSVYLSLSVSVSVYFPTLVFNSNINFRYFFHPENLFTIHYIVFPGFETHRLMYCVLLCLIVRVFFLAPSISLYLFFSRVDVISSPVIPRPPNTNQRSYKTISE